MLPFCSLKMIESACEPLPLAIMLPESEKVLRCICEEEEEEVRVVVTSFIEITVVVLLEVSETTLDTLAVWDTVLGMLVVAVTVVVVAVIEVSLVTWDGGLLAMRK